MHQAKLYSKYHALQKSDAQMVIDNYFPLIKWKCDERENILDVGCADGDVTLDVLSKKLPKNFNKLIGSDISPQMIEFANKHNKNPRISFEILDIAIDRIPRHFKEEFDHIFSFYCLHWIQEQKKALALKNMFQMLKPGGEILLSSLLDAPSHEIYEIMANSRKWSKYMDNVDQYILPFLHSKDPEKELGELLQEAGFATHTCRIENRCHIFPNLDNFRDTIIVAVNPFISKIPDNEVSDYIKDYFGELRKMRHVKFEKCTNNEEERLHYPYKFIVAFASKHGNV